MERLGNHLKKHITELQSKVEEKLDVNLGRIDVLPFPKCVDEILLLRKEYRDSNRIEKFLWKGYVKSFAYFLEDFYAYAKAGNSTIYYSRGPIANLLLTEKEMTLIGLHELSHIAHSRILGKGWEEIKVPEYIKEGFADSTAIEIMGDIYPFFSASPLICGNGYRKFEKELLDRGISDFESINKFVLDFPEE